jgi:peptidyl-prolyl cis-trans isomerase C
MQSIIQKRLLALVILFFSSTQVVGEEYKTGLVLAEVNGKNITLDHIIAAVAKLPSEYNTLESDYILEGVLNQIVKQEIMAQILDTSEKFIEVSLENEIRSIKAKYSVEKLMEGFPRNDQLLAAYETATETIQSLEEFNASHILVESEKEALSILDSLKAGFDFSKLAQEKSTGPSGPNGGQLGWFGPGQMVPEFEAAVLVLEIGSVSQPVKTQFGWHIVKLNDRRVKALPSFEEMKPELVQQLSQSRIDQLLKIETDRSIVKMLDTKIEAGLIRNLDLLKN